MKKLIRPYSFLFYFLVVIVFFFLGVIYAGIIDAAKNQGLAGGAIVLGYGVISAFFAFLVSLFAVYKLPSKVIIKYNKILVLIVVGLLAYFTWKYYTNIKPKREQQQLKVPRKPIETSLADVPLQKKPTALLYKTPSKSVDNRSMGLGMFKPNIFNKKTLLFYGNINFEKSILEHQPTDSITFKQKEYGGFDIATAPPWLVPAHLKLDYDILYFNVVSVSESFYEVIVNTTTNRTTYVRKQSGTLLYWPEFLLGVNSVEFINSNTQNIYTKPLDHAVKAHQKYSFMRPLSVKQNWMQVLLIDDNFNSVGKGWIKWVQHDKLMITYNLLS